jgi:hypothetical protein
MKLELVVMPFFPLKHEALCEAQARLILKQVVELVEQFKRVNADGQCNGLYRWRNIQDYPSGGHFRVVDIGAISVGYRWGK